MFGKYRKSFCRIPKFNPARHYWRHKARLTSPRRFAKPKEHAMTPQERQLVDDLFDRLSKVEGAPRDPDADGRDYAGSEERAKRGLCAGADGTGAGRGAQAAHDRIEELEGAAGASTEPRAVFLVRCAMRSSANQPRARCRTSPRRATAAGQFGTAARCCNGRPRQDDMIRATAKIGLWRGSYNQGSYNQGYGAPQWRARWRRLVSRYGGGGRGRRSRRLAAAQQFSRPDGRTGRRHVRRSATPPRQGSPNAKSVERPV